VPNETFAPGKVTNRPSANLVQHMVVDDIENYLEIKGLLGEGNYGRVMKAVDKTNGTHYALKIIEMSKKADRDALRNELYLLRRIQHPNIVRVVASYEDASNMYMLMELCTGGELWRKVKKDKVHFEENDVKKIMRKALSAICYMHEEGMCHRDLKLENFLYESEKPDADIKICDFGLSIEHNGKAMSKRLGTIEYLAPEVIREDYTDKCDMWSLGCICYELLVGKTPYVDPDGDNQKTMINIIKCETPFKEERWLSLSKHCRSFVEFLLQEDTEKRWNADQALRHPWLKEAEGKDRAYSDDHSAIVKIAAESFRMYDAQPKVKQAAMMALALSTAGNHEINGRLKMAPPSPSRSRSGSLLGSSSNLEDEVGGISLSPKRVFETLDRNHHGTISLEEFCEAMHEAGVSDKEAKELFSKVDQDRNNKIHYLEFLAATLTSQEIEETMLKASFDLLDRDRNGEITTENLLGLFGNSFKNKAGTKAVKEMIRAVDINHSGTITYDEYVIMMRNWSADKNADAECKTIQVEVN